MFICDLYYLSGLLKLFIHIKTGLFSLIHIFWINALHLICGLQRFYPVCGLFFLFFPIIFISWRLITLQYCSGFCHTLTWISHGFTCVPHPEPPPTSLPIPSLWVIPVHQPRALVSCIQPGLAICFHSLGKV